MDRVADSEELPLSLHYYLCSGRAFPPATSSMILRCGQSTAVAFAP